MKIGMKLLLFLYSLAIGIISLIAFAVGTKLVGEATVMDWMESLYDSNQVSIIVSIVTLLVAVLSFIILLSLFSRSEPTVNSVSKKTDLGQVMISLETLQGITLKAARRIKGIEQVESKIRPSEAGIEVLLRCTVDGDTPIEPMTNQVQEAVKQQIEAIAGIQVTNVSVAIAALQKQAEKTIRVE